MAEIHKVGSETESRALEWFALNRRGVLVKKNYRCKQGEIDLIFEERSFTLYDAPLRRSLPKNQQIPIHEPLTELVFVEVRYRPKEALVSGIESVGWKKQLRMKRAAEHFLASYRGNAKTLRYDLLVWDGWDWFHMPNLHFVH